MKEKLKTLMKNKLFIGSVCAVLTLAIAVTAILLLPDKTGEPLQTPGTTDTAGTATAPDIDIPEADTQPVSEVTEALPSDISANMDDVPQSGEVETGGKAEEPVQAVTPVEPEQSVGTSGGNEAGGVVIGNPPVEESYSCGSDKHHCQNSDTHAYILNLELNGCEMCGSHSCPSFYGTDEWGGASIDYTKCPASSDKNNPAKYCQVCGREMWSQSNPTGCFSYLQDTQCECGELVKGNTCHHH